MKWDVKHDKAKEIIVAALDEAQMWFTDKEKIAGLTEEEVGEVNKELTTMLDSIRKRYKLDVRLPENTAEIAVEPQAAIETTEAEEKPQEEEKPKRGCRKASTGEAVEKKPRTRKKKEAVA